MACYHPLDAKVSPSGKPIFKNNINFGRFTRLIKLPCGRCIGCKLDRSKQWAIRLMHEAQFHEEKCFITLTIDEKKVSSHPPAAADAALAGSSPRSQTQDSSGTRTHETRTHDRTISLSKGDAQLLTKRLREQTRVRNPSSRVKYYLVGEYGEKYSRPHYHIALYGEEFRDDRYQWRHDDSGPIYRSSRLEKLWPYGNSEIGTLTFKSAAYIARYITKKLTPGRTDESQAAYDAAYLRAAQDGTNYYIQPEFSHISNGLGLEWFKQYATDAYPHDYVVIDGKKLKPPRYYDKKLAELGLYEILLGGAPTINQIKEEREEKSRDNEVDGTPERLRAREKVELARLQLNNRKLETT